MSDQGPVEFGYEFTFDSGETVETVARLDRRTLALLDPTADHEPPPWTALSAISCRSCELEPATNPICPVAASLAGMIERFGNHQSYEKVEVRVTSAERIYSARTTLQHALSSLIGILMVGSGCPTMDRLRPMVRFHLPLATLQETVFRATSSYLLGQYLRMRHGLEPDWDMAGLEETYRRVHQVNIGIARCLRQAAAHDANANALVRLDLFTDGVAFSIRDALKDLEYLFAPVFLADRDQGGEPGST